MSRYMCFLLSFSGCLEAKDLHPHYVESTWVLNWSIWWLSVIAERESHTGRGPRYDEETRNSQAGMFSWKAELTSSHLWWNAEHTDSRLKLKREASQVCVCIKTGSYADLRFNIKKQLWGVHKMKSNDHRVWHKTRHPHRICWSATSTFELKRDPCVDVKPAFESLSSVIFKQPTYIEYHHLLVHLPDDPNMDVLINSA